MSAYSLFSDGTARQESPVSLNLEQATSLIIERARQLVNQLVEDRGHDKPPFLSEEYARLLDIKRIEKTDLGEVGAVLLRFHGGYVIKVNQKHNLARQNFSCAHEIGHTLLSELRLEPSLEDVEFRTFNPQAQRIARARAKERLCDAAATELLMPEMVFKKYLSGFAVSINSIERLANIFRVSVQAAAIRIAEASAEPCIALLWLSRPGNKSKALRLAWHVGPGNKSTGKANYAPVHTLVRHTSTLYRAYQGETLVKSSNLFRFGTATKRCPMESRGFGREERRYVISLAFPGR